MKIIFAADHRGFKIKEAIKSFLADGRSEVEDVGAFGFRADDDYVDFAEEAVKKMLSFGGGARAILVCGSGHGMDMVANKHRGVRAALVFNNDVARQSREHENANVLILAADWLTPGEAQKIVKTWLDTPFGGEARHKRRLKKIEEIEERNFK